MKILSGSLLIVSIFQFSGCSGGGGPKTSSNTTLNAVVSASQVETSKLQNELKKDRIYKIEDSEVSALQNEGIFTQADKAQLKAIQ